MAFILNSFFQDRYDEPAKRHGREHLRNIDITHMEYILEQLPGDSDIDGFRDLGNLNHQKMFIDDYMLDPFVTEKMEGHITREALAQQRARFRDMMKLRREI